MVTFNSDPLTSVAETGALSKLTRDLLLKPTPLIVSVKVGLPSVTMLGEMFSMPGLGCPKEVVRMVLSSFFRASTQVAPSTAFIGKGFRKPA